MLKDYLKLLRVKHYIKNTLVFFPIIFGRALFNSDRFIEALEAFVCLCLASSLIYIFNDLHDVDKDRNHPSKKHRPIASGRISQKNAVIAMFILGIPLIATAALFLNNRSITCILVYIFVNILYSLGFKNVQIVDVAILASGFVIRIILGGTATGVSISRWLYLVIVAGSLYMGLGKRRNELKLQSGTRDVLEHYNIPFLDKNMYVCAALANVFYALWTLDMDEIWMMWTVPAFIIILMRYSLDIENESDGDPIEVILSDKVLLIMIGTYAIAIFALLYIF